ncbi:MAG: T9SS type A sorting domain-containing protein [Bacteroidales bacterium]|nr:T9SS type A sorting domain-containing protein [Bacteroidales bacterium]
MKNIVLIIISIFTAINLQAQSPNFQWVKTNQGSQGSVTAVSSAINSLGEIYIIGGFTGTIDFNPSVPLYYGLTAGSTGSSYIQKLNANGGLVWVKKIDFIHGGLGFIEIGDNGSLIITGNFKDSIDIDPGTGVYMLHSNGEYDVFILKLSSNGSFIWAKSFGGPEDDVVRDLVVDSKGNIYSHGEYKDTVDFDPGPGTCIYGAGYNSWNYALNNAFMQKLDKNGNFVWAKAFLNNEPGGGSRGISIDLDSEGNIYCAGTVSSVGVDFDPGTGVRIPPANAMSNMYLVKLDSLANYVWATFTTYTSIWGKTNTKSLIIDRYNNIYTTGTFGGNVDFDPGPDTLLLPGHVSGNFLAFIQKYDQNGNFLWAKSYGRENNTDPMSLATDTFGNIYSTGFFDDSTDLDPGPDTLIFYTQGPGSYSRGAYLQKLNTTGNLIWAGILQGNQGVSDGWDINVDNNGNIFLTGKYGATVDFDIGPNVHNSTSSNFASYILKLSQCKTLTTDYVTACDSLIWMDGVTYYQSTQSAYFTLPSSTGCDSIICLSLNIPQIDASVSVSSYGVFSSNQNLASYQWLDCNNGLAALVGDTLQTFTPTLNGSYAVAINLGGCVDTSVCIPISNVSIEEIAGYNIKLYPNPNTGKFVLDLGNMQAAEVRILNTIGQEIFVAHNIKNQYFNMDLQAGIYFMEIRSESVSKTIKFVVR